jgi:hypothetical protein
MAVVAGGPRPEEVDVRLQFEAGPAVEDPTPDQVTDGLRRLSLTDSSFAILDSGPLSYIQVAAEGEDDYLLEYQEGSVDQHYQASAPVTLDQVTAAFLSYLGQDDGWRTSAEWRHLPVGGASASAPATGRGSRRSGHAHHGATGTRLRVGKARPATSGRTPVGRVIFYAILIPITVIFAALLLRAGIGGALATFGAIGEPGYVVVTSCQSSGRSVSCYGIFTPSRGVALPTRVSVQGAYSPDQISSGHRIPVHLLAGDAWPEGMATAPDWIIPLGFGCFFVVGFVVGAVGTIRHWLGRRASRSRAGA